MNKLAKRPIMIDFNSFDLTKRTVVIDADTLVYSSAAAQQKLQYTATNKHKGKAQIFEGIKLYKAWLEEHSLSADDFDLTSEVIITGEARFAFHSIKQKIEAILQATQADDYRICIGGIGNFRMEYKADFVNYKGVRPPKPVFLQDCKEFVKGKYKDKVLVADGQEADDILTIIGWWYFKQKGTNKNSWLKEKLILSCVDKDIQANVVGYFYNYQYPEVGIEWNSGDVMVKKFCTQILVGDSVDNIDGIKYLTKEIQTKYGMRKTSGCGKVSAEAILGKCKGRKEMLNAVIEAYISSWPNDYKQRLQEMCFFLWLRREENEMFSFEKYAEKMGVKYE